MQGFDGTDVGPNLFVGAASRVILDLELDERQLRHLHVKLEVAGVPHGVEPIVLHVLGLALVVRFGVVGVAPDAHLDVRVDHLSVRLAVRPRQVLTTDDLREWRKKAILARSKKVARTLLHIFFINQNFSPGLTSISNYPVLPCTVRVHDGNLLSSRSFEGTGLYIKAASRRNFGFKT